MKVNFTDKKVRSLVNKLPTREQKQFVWVEKQSVGRIARKAQAEAKSQAWSLILSVGYGGSATWSVGFYRDGTRKRRLPDGSEKIVATKLSATAKLGDWGDVPPAMGLADARAAGREFMAKLKTAETQEQSAQRDATFATVAQRWLVEHVEAAKLRTAKQMRRHLDNYVLPGWGARPINAIDQDHVNELLDRVAENNGPATANRLLTTVSSLMTWWRAKTKSYGRLPPAIVPRMRRPERSRKRKLDDRELRVLWKLTGDGSVFSGLVRTLLLTGQRLTTVHTMKWSDIGTEGDDAGVWTVDVADVERMKGTIVKVRLPSLVLDTLKALPKIVGSDNVFPGITAALVDVIKNKRRLHKAMAEALLAEHGVAMERWTLHDLRRSFRSRLVEKCKVDPIIAELVLGHRLHGVMGVYERAEFFDKKSDALQAFATHLLGVVSKDVVQLRAPVAA